MSKIFVDQTCLRIILTTGVNITGAKDLKICYRKPDGVLGELDAYVQSYSDGIIFHDLDSDDTLLDLKGTWKFWSYVKFSDNREARGETVAQQIYEGDQ